MDRTIDRIRRCIPITVGVGGWIRSTTRAARSIHPPIHCTALVSTHPQHCAAAVVSSCPPTIHSLTHLPCGGPVKREVVAGDGQRGARPGEEEGCSLFIHSYRVK